MLDLLEGANDGLYSGICVFDLAKCVDTIDHDTLLIKLKSMELGVQNSFLNPISNTEINVDELVQSVLMNYRSLKVFLKGLFLDHYCF